MTKIPDSVDGLHHTLCLLMAATGLATFVNLLINAAQQAPYGRYSSGRSSAWGPMLGARLAWLTQELPSLLVPLLLLMFSKPAPVLQQLDPRSALLYAFLAHYAYRSLVYPLLIRGGKGTALAVWAMAAAFCAWNGFLQGWFLLHQLPAGGPWRPTHALGLSMWAAGWLCNIHSDAVLRGLRSRAGDAGYKIPHGGLFEYVSAANYFAEMVEWTGFAIASGGLAPAAFAFFTFCNLAPRGVRHHWWYKATFKNAYPATRRAVIPLVW